MIQKNWQDLIKPTKLDVQAGEDPRRIATVVAELQDAPAPQAHGIPCATCGKPMRILPSTRRGDFFHRCSDCNVTLPIVKTAG